MIDPELDWYKEEGATTKEIAAVAKTFKSISNGRGVDAPVEYLSLLSYSNGGEGPLSVQPYNFILERVSEVIDRGFIDSYKDSFPGYFVVGGSGGGEYVAIELSSGKIVALDMTNSDVVETRAFIAESFKEFLSYVGVESEDA